MNKVLKISLIICSFLIGIVIIAGLISPEQPQNEYTYEITDRTSINQFTERVWVNVKGKFNKYDIENIAHEVRNELVKDKSKNKFRVYIYDRNIDKISSDGLPFKTVVYNYTIENNKITESDTINKNFDNQPTHEEYRMFEAIIGDIEALINNSEDDEIEGYQDTIEIIDWQNYSITKEEASELLTKIILWIS